MPAVTGKVQVPGRDRMMRLDKHFDVKAMAAHEAGKILIDCCPSKEVGGVMVRSRGMGLSRLRDRLPDPSLCTAGIYRDIGVPDMEKVEHTSNPFLRGTL